MPMIVIVATGRPSVSAPPKTVRPWRTVLRALGHAVDALDADRGRPLALRAGGPHAPLAAHVRLAVGVPRAHRNLLHGIRVCRLLTHVVHPSPVPAARASGSVLDLDALDDDVVDRLVLDPVGTAASLSTTSRLGPSATSPKIVCLPLSHGVAPTVMKNCEPLVPLPMRLPALAMASR